MTSPASLARNGNTDGAPTWESLKRAISTSSGFKRWQQQSDNASSVKPSTASSVKSSTSDELVIAYLRETLETLAY
ncbi:MAG: hypothetical protein VKL39_20910 [Leptolyngbyaceae bacterium]|nr:hypothetical protein [Leptolyngbyaceae bacterium]